ncbi:hypothetical protein [Streptomyces sp. NPDC006739]|uniref:hypothetical protein n=1 Tax=Streptomyces sp. NPDC006739 TaxID=3364763 RepID=UPI0036ABC801
MAFPRNTPLLKWTVRVLCTVLAMAASALLTAGSFGIAYGAASTPDWWASVIVVLGALAALACLLGLPGVLLASSRPLGKLDFVVAACVVLTTVTFYVALHWQALHDRGRVEQAVVTSVRYEASSPMDGGSWVARLSDLSGHRLNGTLGGHHLHAGDRLTVTVDPEGRFPVQRGSRPEAPRNWWRLSALLAAFQALLSCPLGFSAARQNERSWFRRVPPRWPEAA